MNNVIRVLNFRLKLLWLLLTLYSIMPFYLNRLLVGLRWWSEPKDDGEDHWVFECKVDEKENIPFNEKIFWLGQIGFTITWLVFLIMNVLAVDISNVLN